MGKLLLCLLLPACATVPTAQESGPIRDITLNPPILTNGKPVTVTVTLDLVDPIQITWRRIGVVSNGYLSVRRDWAFPVKVGPGSATLSMLIEPLEDRKEAVGKAVARARGTGKAGVPVEFEKGPYAGLTAEEYQGGACGDRRSPCVAHEQATPLFERRRPARAGLRGTEVQRRQTVGQDHPCYSLPPIAEVPTLYRRRVETPASTGIWNIG